jgi:hypothetical protein
VADANAYRAVFIMYAHGDDRAFEARIGHAGHCEKKLAREEAGLFNHGRDNERRRRDGQGLRATYAEPICRFNAT